MNLILYVLLLLIILSCFGKHLNKYNCGLTSLLIIFVVVFLMTDELDKSLLISLGGTFLLSLIRCPLNIEGLENIIMIIVKIMRLIYMIMMITKIMKIMKIKRYRRK